MSAAIEAAESRATRVAGCHEGRSHSPAVGESARKAQAEREIDRTPDRTVVSVIVIGRIVSTVISSITVVIVAIRTIRRESACVDRTISIGARGRSVSVGSISVCGIPVIDPASPSVISRSITRINLAMCEAIAIRGTIRGRFFVARCDCGNDRQGDGKMSKMSHYEMLPAATAVKME